MTNFKITTEQLEEVLNSIDNQQILRVKSILKNLEVIESESSK